MTRICRFDDDRLGLVQGNEILDVTAALDGLPRPRWPLPRADLLVRHLDDIVRRARELSDRARRLKVADARLLSPIANPPKIIAAPVNYLRHQAEALADGGVNFEKNVKTIAEYGLFLKSATSLVGASQGVEIRFPDRRTDHEIELVAVIGREGRDIPASRARQHIAGYTIGLDMTVRGPEDRSLRKSLDGFSVLGPWLVTADEILDPNALSLRLEVNGELRQSASTCDLIFNVERLVEYASSYYTLYAGDVIFTGTPEGVGPVRPGDVMRCVIEQIGEMRVAVTGSRAART
ncbi:MAG TPA: fumarylacetoacetate hydrolase family protein [Steroidobacteraceae bacterium]|nr:fumarylacetoacetate hydrolase family protein [Steroidobacteraceae bacterium]